MANGTFPKFMPQPESGPQVTQPGGLNANEGGANPTGALTVGNGVHKTIPIPQMVGEKKVFGSPDAATGVHENDWTNRGDKTSVHDGPIKPWQNESRMAPVSEEVLRGVAEHFAKVLHLDEYVKRVRKNLFYEPWERRVGAVSLTSDAVQVGPGFGVAGTPNVQPGRVLLDCIHNPTDTPCEVHLHEQDGDPQPKVAYVIPAYGNAPLPAQGLLFNRGITVSYSQGPLTFGGRSLND